MFRAEQQSVISPTSFAVAPELIGLPLAGGGRRLVAMLIDLAFVGLLLKAGSVFLAIGAAFALLRASSRWTTSRRWTVQVARAVAALLLFLGVLKAWHLVRDKSAGVEQTIEADLGNDTAKANTGASKAAAF